ncbi:hypothetical protein F2Q69_00056141 [Brassica cretica]|uniref:Uncharacterized protein n=1 Tax=Brassica cretica TaxID=69181 RepID=A0A8S9MWY5_BRACR|nr:hypothetical protein F2Q69_00056141 [Brassica cretica]
MTPVTKDTVKEEKAVNTEEKPIEAEAKPEGKESGILVSCYAVVSYGVRLVVNDVVFLVDGLPSIVYARLGFQDLAFGDLTSMLFFIAQGWLHAKTFYGKMG